MKKPTDHSLPGTHGMPADQHTPPRQHYANAQTEHCRINDGSKNGDPNTHVNQHVDRVDRWLRERIVLQEAIRQLAWGQHTIVQLLWHQQHKVWFFDYPQAGGRQAELITGTLLVAEAIPAPATLNAFDIPLEAMQ